jgi:hypothetical protein
MGISETNLLIVGLVAETLMMLAQHFQYSLGPGNPNFDLGKRGFTEFFAGIDKRLYRTQE